MRQKKMHLMDNDVFCYQTACGIRTISMSKAQETMTKDVFKVDCKMCQRKIKIWYI